MDTKTQQQWAVWLRRGLWAGFAILATVPIWTVSTLFFPFITTKALIFRAVVGLCAVLYLALCAVDQTARPRRSWLLAAFAAFVGVSALGSFFGPTPWISFWGDFERSEGLVTWVYLLVLLVITSGVLTDRRAWLKLFDIVLGSSAVVSLIALAQLFGVSFIRISNAGRVNGTIGNAAFFASYLLLMIGLCALMAFMRRHSSLRWWYAGLALVHAVLLVATGTRGAVIGLIAGIIIAAILTVIRSKNQIVRGSAIGLVLIVVLLGGVLYTQRNAAWVQNNGILSRFATISLADRSVQTRFWAWGSVLQGMQADPKSFVVGYGMENLSIPFDRQFNPLQYEDAGSVVWFDRAHNIILDRLATGGVLGLGLYLSLIILPIAALWRRQKQIVDGYWIATWATALLVGYFVQNLFVFDSIVSYLPWVFILGFVWTVQQEGQPIQRLPIPTRVAGGLAVCAAIGFFPLAWYTQYLPARAGSLVINAIRLDQTGAPAQSVINGFTEALELGTYGNQELRIQFTQVADQWIADGRLNNSSAQQLIARIDAELQVQIAEQPRATSNYLLAARHWYNTRAVREVQVWYQEETAFLDQAVRLSPTRPDLFYEYGFMEVAMGEKQKAAPAVQAEHFAKAQQAFAKAIALNPAVAESYVNAFLLPLAAKNDDQARAILADGRTHAPNFQRNPEPYLSQMANNAVNYGRFLIAKELYSELVTIAPGNIEYPVKQAVAMAYAGDDAGAIALAEIIKKNNPSMGQQVDTFIAQIKTGFYREEAKKFQR